MKKQLCSLLTALALAVGLLPSAARAAENAPSFADVPAAAWYADAVQYVYENGLMTGVSESEFAPDGTEFKYTVDELNPPEGYTKTVDGLNIKNTYSVEEPPAPSPEPPAPSPKPPVTAPPALNVFGGFISGQLGDCVD